MVTLLFVDFSKAFDTIHRGKMEQILPTYGLPNETVASITKGKVCSPDGDIDFFIIDTGVLQWDTLSSNLFINRQDYVLRIWTDLMKGNGFSGKARSRRYPAQTITDADFAENIELLANTLAQAESLLHGLERAASGIGLHVSTAKTGFVHFN